VASTRCTETLVGSTGAAIAVGGANQPREETNRGRRPLRSARKNAVDHISSAPSWQPGHIDQLKTVQPALGVLGHRSLTVGAQPLGEIGSVPASPPGVKAAGFEPAQVRNSTLSSAAITTV
jgi:hypothetical protein